MYRSHVERRRRLRKLAAQAAEAARSYEELEERLREMGFEPDDVADVAGEVKPKAAGPVGRRKRVQG